MSRTKETVERVVGAVAEATEVPSGAIMSRCSSAEVVDARWLAVALLHGCGMYPMRIAAAMGITPRYVQYIITDFEDRMALSRPLRTNYEKIAKKLRNDLETTAL